MIKWCFILLFCVVCLQCVRFLVISLFVSLRLNDCAIRVCSLCCFACFLCIDESTWVSFLVELVAVGSVYFMCSSKDEKVEVEIQELCFRCGCKGGTSVSHRCHFDFTSIRFVASDSKCCSVFSVLLSILLLRPKMVPGFSGKWRAPMAKYLFTATWMVKGRHQRAQPMIYSPNSACAWRILTSSL